MTDSKPKKVLKLAVPAEPDADSEDWAQESAPPRERGSKGDQKRRKQALKKAASEYGTDFVRKLKTIRDPNERILFVAESVFAKKGFAGARTQEIADLASVNKAMIHYYFDSKQKLYHALLDKILFDLIKLTQETARDDLTYPQQLEVFYKGFFDYVATHKNFSRITSMEVGSNDRYLPRLVETFFKPLFDRGVNFIKQGIANGDFKKINPRQFLVTIYAMTIAYFSDAEFVKMVLDDDPLSEKRLKERRELLLDMIFAALRCKRP
jgi:TetR/AcrR family transcriptional regulator